MYTTIATAEVNASGTLPQRCHLSLTDTH